MEKPSSEWTVATLKELVLNKIEDNDKRYEQRFLAQEKAVLKSEESQKETNAKSNEFRASLDDSNKMKQDRKEAELRDNALDNKIDIQRLAFERELDGVKKEISGLRESRSIGTGKDEAVLRGRERSDFNITIAVALGVGVLSLVVGFLTAYLIN